MNSASSISSGASSLRRLSLAWRKEDFNEGTHQSCRADSESGRGWLYASMYKYMYLTAPAGKGRPKR